MTDTIQREVWNSIAEKWHQFRKRPIKEAAGFLGEMQDNNGVVLDLACGSGRNFTTFLNVVGVDFSKNMLLHAKEKAKKEQLNAILVIADASELPFKNEAFDNLLFANSFHCVESEKREKCLGEIKRVARTGSRIFISVWNKHQPRFFFSGKETFIPWKNKGMAYQRYYYLFTKNELKNLLAKSFEVLSIHGSADKAFKLFPRNIIAIVEKAS